MSKDRVCAVIGCRRINYYVYKDAGNPQIKFFRFPRQKAMCIKWIEQLNRLDLYPILEEHGSIELWMNYRVCSEHFTDDNFEKPGLFAPRDKKRHRSLLLKSAIPTINLGDRNEIYIAPGPEIKEEPKEEEVELADAEPVLGPEEVIIKSQIERIDDLETKLEAAERLIKKYEELMGKHEEYKSVDEINNEYINFHVKNCTGDCDDCRKEFALDLYLKAPRIYKVLQEKYSLPHTLVLYRWKFKKQQQTT